MNGTTTCAIGNRDGQVVISFPSPVEWAAFDPETARQIGEAMAREAYGVKYGRPPQGKSVLSEELQTRIMNKATIIVRTLMEKNRAPGFIANEVVNAILMEIA